MVVGDHHVDALFAGVVHLIHRRDAVVHRDNESGSLFGEPVDGRPVKPVAVPLAFRQLVKHIRPARGQIAVQQHRRGDAVRVVIPENGDPLAAVYRPLHPLDRQIHIRETERVLIQFGTVQEFCCVLRRRNTARVQQERQKRMGAAVL